MEGNDTPPNLSYSEKTGRTPAVLAGIVLVVGAVVSWMGLKSGPIVGSSQTANEELASSLTTDSVPSIKLPSGDAQRQALLVAGEKLAQAKCSGCHAHRAKLTGPSFVVIANQFTQADTTQLSPNFVQALDHQRANWDGYENAPPLSLTPEEKQAVGYWILHSFVKTEPDDVR